MSKKLSANQYNYLEVRVGKTLWVAVKANPAAMPSRENLTKFLQNFIDRTAPGQTVEGFCMSSKHRVDCDPTLTNLTGGPAFGDDIETNLF